MAWPGTTFNVTGILIGLPPAVGAVMVTVPVYWPTARLPAFAETCTVPVVVPLPGVTESQLTEPVLAATAVKLNGWPLLRTCTFCAGGAGPPACWLNVSTLGLSVSVPAVTCSVTGIVTGLFATAAPPG